MAAAVLPSGYRRRWHRHHRGSPGAAHGVAAAGLDPARGPLHWPLCPEPGGCRGPARSAAARKCPDSRCRCPHLPLHTTPLCVPIAGFLALYLIGTAVGQRLLAAARGPPQPVLKALAAAAAACWAVHAAVCGGDAAVSRRLVRHAPRNCCHADTPCRHTPSTCTIAAAWFCFVCVLLVVYVCMCAYVYTVVSLACVHV